MADATFFPPGGTSRPGGGSNVTRAASPFARSSFWPLAGQIVTFATTAREHVTKKPLGAADFAPLAEPRPPAARGTFFPPTANEVPRTASLAPRGMNFPRA